MALARSHDVWIRGGWEDAPLREVIEGALAAYGGEAGRSAHPTDQDRCRRLSRPQHTVMAVTH